MKRLFQLLSNNIYPGDIVQNNEVPNKPTLHFVKSVRKLKLTGQRIVLVNSEGYSNHFTTCEAISLTKMKRLSFEDKWSRLNNRGSILNLKPMFSLEEQCKNRNIGYLYNDLQNSKTVNDFNFNMSLINKMLATSK